MSRDAEAIVLAREAEEVMDPLTRDDPERTWRGRFVPIAGQWGYEFGWALEFEKMRARKGLLSHLESLPWPYPLTVQVLLRDQDDDCFGLWMFQEGRLVEVALARTERFHQPAPPTEDFEPDPGMLLRTDGHEALPRQTPEALRDTRPPW
ncbi:hypothetical protein [Streptomyces sp. SID9727]|uniref:hypothetical protein n=1 Tax=Streptomyces sp. SID9727 TaxID=2706114 RepID=UPI0013C89892|nr:hypothetical protein [Streptomyces sp. SID9727]NEC69927.1 hypothetical protein [Streptomyces sp. SID9727]